MKRMLVSVTWPEDFTPVCKIPKRSLDKHATKRLQKQTKGKTPAVLEKARSFTMAGGDQGAENCAGHLKNTMRRLGTVGRANTTKGAAGKSIQSLSAARLLRLPGMSTVLQALASYRKACAKGEIKISPKNALNASHSGSWLQF